MSLFQTIKARGLKSAYICCSLFVFLFVGGNVPTFAASTSSSGVAISPPVFSNLQANQGDVLTNTVRIFNTSASSVTYDVIEKDFVPQGKTGSVLFSAQGTDQPYSLDGWISLSKNSVTVKSNGFADVSFTITVPRNAASGGRYGAIVFTSSGTSSTGSSVQTQIASLILLTVSGDLHLSGAVTGFTATNVGDPTSPVNITTDLKDLGNIQIHPKGNITITNMFGQKVETLALAGVDIIPGYVREEKVIFNPNGAWGSFTAHLSSTYSVSGKEVAFNASTSFLVIPIKLIIAVIAIILIILLLRDTLVRGIKQLFSKS